MFTKHCIRFALGWCPRETREKMPFTEPLYLLTNQTRLQLTFDCMQCEMQVTIDN